MVAVDEIASIFPQDLLDQDPAELLGRRWWVLYTRSRQEKALTQRLEACGVPFYLPLIDKTSLCRGREIHSRVPLFANYVFLFGTPEERIRALESNRISRTLEVKDEDRLRFDLRQIRHLISTKVPLTLESRICEGQRVRVRNGLLAGLEGTVLTRHSKTRLLVSTNFIGQGASVAIEDFRLERI